MTIPRQGMRPPEWTGLGLGEKHVWLFWLSIIVLAITLYVTRCMTRSRYGLAMSAVRQNEIAASASGVNIAIVKTASFGLSGAVTGAAGSLFAIYMGSLYAEGSFTLLAGITLLIGLVIGGERTVLGPIVGALAVVYVPYYTSDLGGGQASAVLFAVVLLFVIFLAPAGVVGSIATVLRRYLVIRDPRPATGDEVVSVAADPSPRPEHLLHSTTTPTERSSS